MPTTPSSPPPVRRRPRRGERAWSIALSALLFIPMLSFAGIAIDLGVWIVQASDTQGAADAAALAAVVALPEGSPAATARARSIASEHGFVHGVDGVTVDLSYPAKARVQVTITKSADQYFTGAVLNGANAITRSSTAEYIPPVPLGSPRNFLGTNNLLTGGSRENFFLSISGECTRREYGDRISVIGMSNPTSGGHACVPGDNGALANPEYDPNGYLFAFTVPDASGGAPVDIQMYDAPNCHASGLPDRFNNFPHQVEMTIYDDNSVFPLSGTQLWQRTFQSGSTSGGDCARGSLSDGDCSSSTALRQCWFTLLTVTEPGTYYIQYDPIFRPGPSSHNMSALRARRNGVFVPCTSDVAYLGDLASDPLYDPTCPQVFAVSHLSIYASISAADPTFFLASLDSSHNGKTLDVTLFDTAEGAQTIELLDPLGDPVVFDWTILCTDATEPGAGGCPGENEPLGGRAGTGSVLDVSGGVPPEQRIFGDRNEQNGKYSDRLVRLQFELPSDITTAYGDFTWWSIRYGVGSNVGDKTTWSVQVLGDPVRLVPNA